MAVIAPTPLFRSIMNANGTENTNLLKKLYAATAEHHPLVKTLIEDVFRCVDDKNSGFVPIRDVKGKEPFDPLKPVVRRKVYEAEMIGRDASMRQNGREEDELAAGAATVRSTELEEERRAAMLKHKTDLKQANNEAQQIVIRRAEQEKLEKERQEHAEAVILWFNVETPTTRAHEARRGETEGRTAGA